MKKRIKVYTLRNQWVGITCLALMLIVGLILSPIFFGGGSVVIASIIVAGVTLEGKDEAIFLAMKEANDKVLTKLEKDYITDTKASELILANINTTLKNLGFDDLPGLKEKAEKVEELQQKLAEQGLAITEMKTKITDEGKQTLFMQVKSNLEKNPDALKQWAEKKSPFSFELKDSPVNFMTSGVTGFSYVATTSTDFPFTHPALPRSIMLNYARVRPTDSALISYADWGSIIAVISEKLSETDRKSKISSLLTAQQSSYHELGDYVKVHERMLADIPYMASEITTLLTDYLTKAVDDALLTTDNWGLIADVGPIAKTYTSTALTGKVKSATYIDCIIAGFVQLFEAEMYPTVIAVNPAIWGLIVTGKTDTYQRDVNGLTVLVNLTPNGLTVNGVPVVMSNKITGTNVLMGDFTKANVWLYGLTTVDMGWDGEDFTYNLRTIKAYEKVHFYVKENEKNAFLYDDLDTILADIEVVGS